MTMPSSLREAGQLAGELPKGGEGVPERQDPPLLDPAGDADDLPPQAPTNK